VRRNRIAFDVLVPVVLGAALVIFLILIFARARPAVTASG
jgi:hypothetical protein